MFDRTTSAKYAIKQLLRRLGVEVTWYIPYRHYDERLLAALNRHGVTLAVDVGANEGQFSGQLRMIGYAGRMASFEPLAAPHASLAARAKHDPLWHVGRRAAIGERAGTLTLNVARNSVSSSSMRMLPHHLAAAPQSEIVGAESVEVMTLDEALAGVARPEDTLFLKIDVQGAEEKVLAGARHTLARTRVMQMELSLVPLYEGQPLADEMIGRLKHLGFQLADIRQEFVDPRDGRLLQADGLFVR